MACGWPDHFSSLRWLRSSPREFYMIILGQNPNFSTKCKKITLDHAWGSLSFKMQRGSFIWTLKCHLMMSEVAITRELVCFWVPTKCLRVTVALRVKVTQHEGKRRWKIVSRTHSPHFSRYPRPKNKQHTTEWKMSPRISHDRISADPDVIWAL